MEFVMSRTKSKSRNTAAATSNGDRRLQAVPAHPAQQTVSTTEDKVHSALADNPGSTTAALALAAGVGRSTAAKILARWGRDGAAIRTTGDGPRNPDTWTLAASDGATASPDTADTPTDATATSSADHASGTDATITDPDTSETQAETGDAPSTEDATAAETPAGTSDADGTQTTDEKITKGGSTGPDALGQGINAATPPPGSDPVAPAPDSTVTGGGPSPDAAPAGTASADTGHAQLDRLPKGGLRALVEEYLTEQPSASFGPAKIGKDLGRSGGAVNNALERLVADGYAIKTCEAPKRFAVNRDKVDVPPSPDASE
jgi:hypothetical protein